MAKLKINRTLIQPTMIAGTYWVKELLPDRNTKFFRLTRLEDGPWYTGWRDDRLNPVELRGEYKFMGPIPADAYP